MDLLHEKTLHFLELTANRLREDVIRMVSGAGSGHIAGPLDIADIMAAMYFYVLRHDPKNPHLPERDRLVLSCGHYCPVLYAALARAGYFHIDELKTLRTLDSRLQGHPHRNALPGIETTSGPLGSGISQAAGIALAAHLDRNGSTTSARSGQASSPRGKYRVYCIASDGEHQEGNTWEGIMFAAKQNLSNLTVIVDRNNIQIDGFTERVMPLEPFSAKYESFGWHVVEVDGHNIPAFIGAIAEAHAIFEKPTVIIAHTIAGKGVSFMERDYTWHSKPFKEGEADTAIKELKESRERMVVNHENKD
ncbi:MAG: transketolase [Patescibacteria group bacterium]|nr:transketolase [Patescibacteria group bacterium]